MKNRLTKKLLLLSVSIFSICGIGSLAIMPLTSCSIVSTVAVTGVTLDKEGAVELYVNDTLQLHETVAPSNATNKNVTWASSNTNVATINQSGLVTAKSAGHTDITVTTVSGEKTAKVSLTVYIEEGTVPTSKKEVKMYTDENSSQDETIYFFENNTDIPYFPIETVVNNHFKNYYECSTLDNYVYTITNKKNDSTLKINLNNNKITYSSLSLFNNFYDNAAPHDEYYVSGSVFNKEKVSSTHKDPQEVTFNLSDYGFKSYIYNGKGYLPIDTVISVINETFGTIYYDGSNIFNLNSSNDTSSYRKKMNARYASDAKLPTNYKQHVYNQLVFLIDKAYGLTGQEKEFRNNGEFRVILNDNVKATLNEYKQSFLNDNTVTSLDKLIIDVVNTELDDGGHTFVNKASKGSSASVTANYGDELKDYSNKLREINSQKFKHQNEYGFTGTTLDEYSLYIPSGEGVGYLNFNTFYPSDYSKTYINSLFNNSKSGFNTYLNRNASNNETAQGIKDVVVDLSSNGGGATAFEGYLLSWLCDGYATQTNLDAKDGSLSTYTYQFDVNYDGEYNEKDYLPEDVHIYLITSRCTFSAANSLAFDLYQYRASLPSTSKKQITFVGDVSGGGSCSVTNIYLPTGMDIQISSNSISSTSDGNFISENGTSIDTEWYYSDYSYIQRSGTGGLTEKIKNNR